MESVRGVGRGFGDETKILASWQFLGKKSGHPGIFHHAKRSQLLSLGTTKHRSLLSLGGEYVGGALA